MVNTAAVGDIDAPTFGPVLDITHVATTVNGDVVEFVTPDVTDNEGVTYGPACSPSSGSFFTIGDTFVNCIAIDQAGNQGTTSFTVSVLPGEIPLVEDITTLETSWTTIQDLVIEGGDLEPGISAGELSKFSTVISSNTTQSVLVSVSVQAEDATILGIGYFKSILGAGDSELTLGFHVPEDAVSGTAKVHVNVYTDWIFPGSGYSISDPITTNIEIIGVEPPDLSAFNHVNAGFPTVHLTDPGFTSTASCSSSITFIEYKNRDLTHDRESLLISQEIIGLTDRTNTFNQDGYVKTAVLIRDWPNLPETNEIGKIKHEFDKFPTGKYDNIKKFILDFRESGLEYLVVDNDNKIFDDLREDPKKYSYLIKRFDSDDWNFKNHFMIYEIDYNLFDNGNK